MLFIQILIFLPIPLLLKYINIILFNFKVLSLSYTKLHFNALLPLLPYLPNLINLSLAFNEMGLVPCNHPPSSNLQSLDLSNNSISEWSLLSSLTSLSNLKELYLEGNLLGSKSIDFLFSNIQFVNFMNTGIQSVDQLRTLLDHFPAVIDIELRENDLYSKSSNERVTLIALFPQLQRMNGSSISIEERTEAELSVLSQEMTKFLGSLHMTFETFVGQSQDLIDKQLEEWSDLKVRDK